MEIKQKVSFVEKFPVETAFSYTHTHKRKSERNETNEKKDEGKKPIIRLIIDGFQFGYHFEIKLFEYPVVDFR